MFKFMKSKKGFTLVELMIVVVIMAILVAVAVPIFSAVTANARKKTCIGNQREIVSQITNQVMSGGATFKDGVTSGTIVVKTNSKGDKLDGSVTDEIFDGVTFQKMFSADNMPFCPVPYGQITVYVAKGDSDGACTVKVYCNSNDKMTAHPASATTVGSLNHVVGQ